MLLNRPKDIYAGGIFVAIGAAAFVLAQRYEIGTASHMGPGYLPALAGIILVALGVLSLVNAVRVAAPDPIEKQPLEPFILVVSSVVAFALLIDVAGLVLAMAALVFIACLRRVFSNPFDVLLLYVGLTAFCVGLFPIALNMPIPIWWQ
jgi:putative tricarboxylic transport membrane protein